MPWAAGPPPAPGTVARFRAAHPFAAQAIRYMIVGGTSVLANALVYLLLRVWWDMVAANLTALLFSTLVSTEINRRFTFGDAPTRPWRAGVQNVGTFVFYAGYSSAVLFLLTALVDDPTPMMEAVAVTAASVLGGAGRFLLLRHWVFRREVGSRDPGWDDDPGPAVAVEPTGSR